MAAVVLEVSLGFLMVFGDGRVDFMGDLIVAELDFVGVVVLDFEVAGLATALDFEAAGLATALDFEGDLLDAVLDFVGETLVLAGDTLAVVLLLDFVGERLDFVVCSVLLIGVDVAFGGGNLETGFGTVFFTIDSFALEAFS